MPQIQTDRITQAILKALEGEIPAWRRPWRTLNDGASSFPANAVSGRGYRGVNFALLAAAGCAYESQKWLTFKQALDLGGSVRKGEHGQQVVFWKPTEREDAEGKKERGLLLKLYTVFNVEQCENIKLPRDRAAGLVRTDQSMSDIYSALKAEVIHGGDMACYIPSHDVIRMPIVGAFTNLDHYKSTAFHELGHWTGSKARLGRDLGNRFGTQAFAAEELVAELTSAYLCALTGTDCALEHHVSYIESWRKLITDDPRAIITASSKAQAAADYIASNGGLIESEEVEGEALAA